MKAGVLHTLVRTSVAGVSGSQQAACAGRSGDADLPNLEQALRRSRLQLPSRPGRVKSPELQARLTKLQKQLDQREYERMTADVTVQASLCTCESWHSLCRCKSARAVPQVFDNVRGLLQERKAKDAKEGGLQTYKQQISYGIHVSVMMGTFYAAGHYGAQSLSDNPVHVSPEHA